MIKDFFCCYARSFLCGDAEIDCNVRLKLGHTLRVVRLLRNYTAEELPPEIPPEAEAAGYLHDLSRFEQFRHCRTFNDSISFDHGDRSAELAEELQLLKDFSPESQKRIRFAVKYHNKLALPENAAPDEARICYLLRDADKTDIFAVLLNYLRHPVNKAVVYQLSPEKTLSAKVAETLKNHRCPSHADLRTEVDFLASKIGWIYDLATASACREIRRRRYLDQLLGFLPQTAEFARLGAEAGNFLQTKSEALLDYPENHGTL